MVEKRNMYVLEEKMSYDTMDLWPATAFLKICATKYRRGNGYFILVVRIYLK